VEQGAYPETQETAQAAEGQSTHEGAPFAQTAETDTRQIWFCGHSLLRSPGKHPVFAVDFVRHVNKSRLPSFRVGIMGGNFRCNSRVDLLFAQLVRHERAFG
jgi:hypothetical protein